MTIPQLLASLAILSFVVGFALYIVDDLFKACGRVLADTGQGSPPPRRSGGEPPAGHYDWAETGDVA